MAGAPRRKFWNLSSPDRQKINFPRFFSAFFEAQTLCVHAIKIWNVSVAPPSQITYAPQAQESPSFFNLSYWFAIETHILKTSGLGFTGVGKKNAFNIVQMKRNNWALIAPHEEISTS
jgi:hypothetical protein